MGLVTVFLLTTLPGGIALIIFNSRLKDLNSIMEKKDPKHKGFSNTGVNLFKIIKVLRKSKNLSDYEKKFLKITLLLFFVNFITVISWMIVIVFFHDKLVN